ncbi:MAG: hypothetical protein ACLRLE_11990 [Turicibacter sp.]
MDIINVEKLIRVLNGYRSKGNTAITLKQLTELYEEYKDTALFGDSSFGYITKPGKQYEEEKDVILNLDSFKEHLRGYDLGDEEINTVIDLLKDCFLQLINLEDINGEVFLGKLCDATGYRVSADMFEIMLKQAEDSRIKFLGNLLF